MSRIIQVCLCIACGVIAAVAQAQSNVGTFSSVVTIQGPVTQTATGNNVKQDLNIGSAQKSKANSFSSVVTTGSITQTGSSGAQQTINVGGMNSSKVDQFNAIVTTGNIEQVGNNGERQEIDIGSVTNSTVTGAATTRVSVGSVKQVGDGEIVLGAVKNSNVQQFNSNLSVQGKVEGRNIRMGSVIGQERYDDKERNVGRESNGSDQSASFQMPNFSVSPETNQKFPLTGTGSIAPLQTPGLGLLPQPRGIDVSGFRHSSSNAVTSAAYVIGAVHAEVKEGKIFFKNDRYDAVVAYIHDKTGNVVDKIVIPGAVDSGFTAAASAVKDTIPALTSGQGIKPLTDYFDKGSAFELDSGLLASSFPEGGAISYASGTPEAMLATVASGLIKSFTTVISAGTSKAIPDSVLGKVSKSVLDKAISDPELLTKATMLMAEDKPSELGKLVTSWLSEKGRNAATASMLDQGFPHDSEKLDKLLDTAIKPLEILSNSLVAVSQFRDAWMQNSAGPRILWYDMPYDSHNDLAGEYYFNWSGTPLEKHENVIFSSKLNDKDNSTKLWNPSTWNDKFEAEYDRYR